MSIIEQGNGDIYCTIKYRYTHQRSHIPFNALNIFSRRTLVRLASFNPVISQIHIRKPTTHKTISSKE